jgi:hypothetical protein
MYNNLCCGPVFSLPQQGFSLSSSHQTIQDFASGTIPTFYLMRDISPATITIIVNALKQSRLP